MASSLEAFLRKDTTIKTDTVKIENSGYPEPMEVDIRGLTGSEQRQIFNRNTKTFDRIDGRGKGENGFDNYGLLADIVATAITAPDLKSAKLQDHFNATSPIEAAINMFSQEDLVKLQARIMELSEDTPKTTGVDPDLIKEAKNS